MGGQACVFYGAAEFSRDLVRRAQRSSKDAAPRSVDITSILDLLVLAEAGNLAHLGSALDELEAHNIAVPAFSADYLRRGHAVHFRCRRTDVAGLRIDVMSTLRGAASFEDLWARRTSIEVQGQIVDLLALEDLVSAKKTQRDKDWPMIRRLVEQSYFSGSREQNPPVEFWLRELRTPELLIDVAAAYPEDALRVSDVRPAVQAALAGEENVVARLLAEEEQEERRQDREYWDPLRRELEDLRRMRPRRDSGTP